MRPSHFRRRPAPGASRRRWRVALLLAAAAGCAPPEAEPPEDFGEVAAASLPVLEGAIPVEGLAEPVEVVRDRWGIPHIRANSAEDLFFAQGFVQAQDRLWQMEMWRRYTEGRMAEVLGPAAVDHDRLVRLLRYRGGWDAGEFGSYHPEGARILESFAAGVNAFVRESGARLPAEFVVTGVRPTPWEAHTSLQRSPTRAVAAARADLLRALRVRAVGVDSVALEAPDPYRPLEIPAGFDPAWVTPEVFAALDGLLPSWTPPLPLLPPFQGWADAAGDSAATGTPENSPGSNNWVVSGRLSASGKPILANDPHRPVTNPSLRYIVHLSAPGWEAIGATEPVLPGVMIGHNGGIAWGLTIVGTDLEDVLIERLDPADPGRVLRGGRSLPIRVEQDTIRVLGAPPQVVEHRFTDVGPIFHLDSIGGRAWVLRSVMHEAGAAEYLGALRFHGARDCSGFMDELRFYRAPSENLICADTAGNIAWQATAASPRRVGEGWDGRLPALADAGYGWDGFREDLPREWNPERGWIATANHDIHPPGYDPPLFFKRGPFPRIERIRSALESPDAWWSSAPRDPAIAPPSAGWDVAHFERLQHDAFSAPAMELLPLLNGWTGATPELEDARSELAGWDGVLRREGREGALFDAWRRSLPDTLIRAPARIRQGDRALARDALLSALTRLRSELGPDPSEWRWGRIHRSAFPHPLVRAWDLPTVERDGGAGTVAATGATYRQIIDLGNPDASVATQAPGQSANPASPFYGDLADSWGRGAYFPLRWSRPAVDADAAHRLLLEPAPRRGWFGWFRE